MNIYEKIYCEESKSLSKVHSELNDLIYRLSRDFEGLRRIESSQCSPIVAVLLRDGKLLQAEHLIKQIDYHLRGCDYDS